LGLFRDWQYLGYSVGTVTLYALGYPIDTYIGTVHFYRDRKTGKRKVETTGATSEVRSTLKQRSDVSAWVRGYDGDDLIVNKTEMVKELA
jgi:hypothetical protein